MHKDNWLTRALAIAGTALVWMPLLFPLAISATRWVQARVFLFDYLLPAEFFPITLLGVLLLFLAARRARLPFRSIGWSLLAAVLLIVGGQVLTMVTGLASGRAELEGSLMIVAVLWLGAFWLAVVAVALSALGLLRALFRPARTVTGEGR